MYLSKIPYKYTTSFIVQRMLFYAFGFWLFGFFSFYYFQIKIKQYQVNEYVYL